MHKEKTIDYDHLIGRSPEMVLSFFKDRVRQKLHVTKTKITQFEQKNLLSQSTRKITLDYIAETYFFIWLKDAKNKNIQKSQPKFLNALKSLENYNLLEQTQKQMVYKTNHVISYFHDKDQGKKWKINVDPHLQVSRSYDFIEILSVFLMLQQGFYPFQGKKQTKSKISVQFIEKLKRRPSRKIATFKIPISSYFFIFSWMVQKINTNEYCCCIYVHQIKQQLQMQKIEYLIDTVFQRNQFAVLPGQTKFFRQKISKGQVFIFGDKEFKFESSKNEAEVRKVLPCKVQKQLQDLNLAEVNQIKSINIDVQLRKDDTNYKSVRYIYKDLLCKKIFNYSLSPSQYDVLESKGNLIVIGRSGTGKTTCALLRLFLKQLNSSKIKTQKNVFLTASPVLIAQINKKYNELKDGIIKAHQHDYFSEIQSVSDDYLTKKFLNRLDQINQSFKRKTFSNFLRYVKFPCFLTIRQYIQSIDAVLQNPFFTVKNQQNHLSQQTFLEYPDQIEWEQKIIKTRKIKINHEDVQQDWQEVNCDYFVRKVWQLPQIKRIGGLSPEIVWSEIYSTIKGSSRAHSFFYKFLDFQTYCLQSKNQFLTLDDKKKVYEIFTIYEKWKQNNQKFDLVDVVNSILIQISKRDNQDLLLTSLFIDQVQDLPPSFIFLAGKIVQQSLFFCGDSAQTIAKGVKFSFSDVREQFSQKYFENSFKLEKPMIKKLQVNFRSQNEIIQLSNCLVRILELMFPQSIDKMPFETSPNKGMKPLIIKPQNSTIIASVFRETGDFFLKNQNNMFGAEKAIIVRTKEDKKNVPADLQAMTCLTYQQCKGLEYNVVILYNFFSSKKAQWSFLKHVEFDRRPEQTDLCFNKKKFGSNIKLYFELCSELKILYTIATRPRSILIICDDNIPPQLQKIWKFFDLVQEIDSVQDFYKYQALVEKLPKNPQKDPDPSQLQLKDENKQQIENQDKILNNPNLVSWQNFRKQWAQQGFKMFFQRKLYSEAAKCFKNIKIQALVQVCQAFDWAKTASQETQSQKKRVQAYLAAAKSFSKLNRIFEAAKCFYLAGSYHQALNHFTKLGIQKYKAECFWKLYYFLEAQQIFFKEMKHLKGFKVIIDSKYWFLFLSRVLKQSQFIGVKSREIISEGLQQGCYHLIKLYSLYLTQNKLLNQIPKLLDFTEKIFFQKYADSTEKKKAYFDQRHKILLIYEKNLNRNGSLQQLKKSRQVGLPLLNQLCNSQPCQILHQFLTIVCYSHQILKKYSKLFNFQKYDTKNIGFQKNQIDDDSDFKILIKNIINLFNVLQNFHQLLLIIQFSKYLGFDRIQELIMIENVMRINSKNSNQRIDDYYRQTHYAGLEFLVNQNIGFQLSIYILLFGCTKEISHLFRQDDLLLQFYLENYENDLTIEIIQKSIDVKPEHTKKQYRIHLFKNDLQQSWSQRLPIKSHLYRQLLLIIDSLSPRSYFFQNAKEKQFIEQFKSLTKQQHQELQQKVKVQKQKALNELQKKNQRLQNRMKKLQNQKIQIIKSTAQQEVKAFNAKIQIAEMIKQYVYFPEQCTKNQSKAYTLKKTFRQIKIQRNKILDQMDKQKYNRIDQEKKKYKMLNRIKQLKDLVNIKSKILDDSRNQIYQIIHQQQLCRGFKSDQEVKISQIQKEIQDLRLQKTGTNRKDKKLQSRIQILIKKRQPFKLQLDQINSQLKKIVSNRVKAQAQLTQINKDIVQAQSQITDNYVFLVQKGLAKFDQQNGQYILLKSLKDIQHYIQKQVEQKIQDIDYQVDYQKQEVQTKYVQILQNVDDYLYYHQELPQICRRNRQNIIKDIQKIKDQIQKFTKQRQDKVLITKARTQAKFIQDHFKMHSLENRAEFIQKNILSASQLFAVLDFYICEVLALFSQMKILKKNEVLPQNKIQQNSTKLQNILQGEDNSFEKIFFLIFFVLHHQEIACLKQAVVRQIYQKFQKQIQIFIEDLIKYDHFNEKIKKTLSILGINIIETFEGDQFKYLQGYCILKRYHNFGNELKKIFFHVISPQYILCRTEDAVKVFQNQIVQIVKQSSFLKEIMDGYELDLKVIKDFNFRNTTQLQQLYSLLIKKLLAAQQEAKIPENQHVTIKTLAEIKDVSVGLRFYYLCRIIIEEQNLVKGIQPKAIQMSTLTNKLIKSYQFQQSIEKIIDVCKNNLPPINSDGKQNGKNDFEIRKIKLKEIVQKSIQIAINQYFVQEKQCKKVKSQSQPRFQDQLATTNQTVKLKNLQKDQIDQLKNKDPNHKRHLTKKNRLQQTIHINSKKHRYQLSVFDQDQQIQTHSYRTSNAAKVYFDLDINQWVPIV